MISSDMNRPSVAVHWMKLALGQAQHDQDDRGSKADRGVVGQHADQEGRDAHDQDGDQEGVLAADAVAEAAEEGRAERTHEEAGSERQQGEDHARGFIDATEELLGDDGGDGLVQAIDHSRRRVGGRVDGLPAADVEAGDACLLHRRHIGHDLGPLGRRDRQRAHLAALHIRQRHQRRFERARNLAADQVLDGGRAAAVRHVGQMGARQLLEDFS
ncbi:hypothetical protein G6F40_014215 [Rhizopus arrhizus]|nr:hypothetical protein G6F40_014215 [Rhizopus arrhizus]